MDKLFPEPGSLFAVAAVLPVPSPVRAVYSVSGLNRDVRTLLESGIGLPERADQRGHQTV